MTEYLITDIRTLVQTWTPGASPREALIAHENMTRNYKLSASTKASNYSDGDQLDVSLGMSSIRGLRCNVVREG